MTEGVRWFIPCSGSVLLNLGWNPALQPALGSSYLNQKLQLGGKKKNVVSVDSFLISHNYPLLFVHTEPFHVFVWVFVVVWVLPFFFFLSILLACCVTMRTQHQWRLNSTTFSKKKKKTLWKKVSAREKLHFASHVSSSNWCYLVMECLQPRNVCSQCAASK